MILSRTLVCCRDGTRKRMTTRRFPLQCGYPTGILEQMARHVGNHCWVTVDERISGGYAHAAHRLPYPVLVRYSPGLRTLRWEAVRAASPEDRGPCLVCLVG